MSILSWPWIAAKIQNPGREDEGAAHETWMPFFPVIMNFTRFS
jgi:hypothetical protein